MKCDQDRWLYMAGQSDFNSRTHVKCDALLQNVKKLSRYFNSRTHVECDEIVCSSWFDREISTHALTWSATALIRKQQLSHFISTHALTWSATMRGMLSEPSMVISTHALTWSATVAMCVQGDWFLFQLTHSRGVRLNRGRCWRNAR